MTALCSNALQYPEHLELRAVPFIAGTRGAGELHAATAGDEVLSCLVPGTMVVITVLVGSIIGRPLLEQVDAGSFFRVETLSRAQVEGLVERKVGLGLEMSSYLPSSYGHCGEECGDGDHW